MMYINERIRSHINTIINQIRDSKGAVSVEFTVVMIFFILIMFLITDFGITLTKQGRLERTSHSLASVIRERKALYQSDESITQNEVNQLLSLAQTLLRKSDLTIVVDALYLAPDPLEPSNNASAYVSKTLSFSAGNNKCQLTKRRIEISQLKELVPYASSTGRWVPIYRVSICIPNERSIFKQLTQAVQNDVLPDLETSDVVISRI